MIGLPVRAGDAILFTDYLLFVGLTAVAAVEAKRKTTDVAAALQQAKRDSRGLNPPSEVEAAGGPWDKYRLPFAVATNGRPFLRQLKEQSGIWFCDLRHRENLSRPLDGWYSPEGLLALLKQDEAAANTQLATAPFHYDFAPRPYQIEAIQAVEGAVMAGRRELLLAVATGTGKTKTCIALIYRLLKAQRFRWVLFLVDRAALGEQAANAFKDTRMESLQTFADIFGIKELDAPAPERRPRSTLPRCRAWCTACSTPALISHRPRLTNMTASLSMSATGLSARSRVGRQRTALPRLRGLHLEISAGHRLF